MYKALMYNAKHNFYEETEDFNAVLDHDDEHIIYESKKNWENCKSALAIRHPEDFFWHKRIDRKNVIFYLPYPIVKSEYEAKSYWEKNPKYNGPIGVVDNCNAGSPCNSYYEDIVREPSGINIYRVVQNLEILTHDPKLYKKYKRKIAAEQKAGLERERKEAKDRSICLEDMLKPMEKLCENLNIEDGHAYDPLVRILVIAHDTVYGKRSTNRILKPIAQKAQHLASIKVPLMNWYGVGLQASCQKLDREFFLDRLRTICLFDYKRKELTAANH